jgi:ABC-type transport system substrate-binding protein
MPLCSRAELGELVINTHVSASLPLMPEAAQLGAEFWRRELGLDVEVRVGDRATTIAASNLTEDLYGQITWTDDATRIDYVGALRNKFGNPERLGRAHDDPELYALTEKALAEFDPVGREEFLKSTLYPRLRDESYHLGIGYVNIPWGVGPRVETWEPYPLSTWPSALHTITLK